jgi:hypothetical protein
MWHVNWKDSALAELAEIWAEASDRKSVTEASFYIETKLKRDPENFGESRSGSTRIGFAEPLVVFFDVIKPDLRVDVLSVSQI